jgi:putative ABC transport system permease protein
VTLIAMMLVGGQSASESVAHEIDSHYPVDVMVRGSADSLPAGAVGRVERLPEVAAAARLPQATVDISGPSASSAGEGMPLTGLPADVAQVLREPALLAAATPGTLLVDQDVARDAQLTTGERVTVKLGGRHTTLVVHVGGRLPHPYLATEADLRRLAPAASTTEVWLRLREGVDVPKAMETVNAAASDVPGLLVGGSAPERAQLGQALDVVLLVVTALLGISVLIAVVGVGNTLSLSVLERTRESALLRAIGLTRGQLRLTVAIEALILAAVGAVVGCLLGIGYGWAGVRALLGADGSAILSVPWGRLGLVVVLALVAGLLASVLPARRAARVAPAVALASE